MRGKFLSHTSKPNQQKQKDVVSKSAANIYPSNKYDFPMILLLAQSQSIFQLKNCADLSQSVPFLQLQACEL